MNRQYFEDQAADLKMQCLFRKAMRAQQRKITAARARSMARRACEADILTDNDKRLIKELGAHLSVNEIARKMETDLVTVAVILEGA